MQTKLLLLITLLCVIRGNSYCQEVENTKVYEIRNNIAVYPCDITGKRLYPDSAVRIVNRYGTAIRLVDSFSTPPLGAKFSLVRPLGNGMIMIRYLLWTKKRDSLLTQYYNDPLIMDTGKTQSLNGDWHNEATSKINKRTKENRRNYEDYGKQIDRFFMIQKYDLDSNCIKVYNSGLRSIAFTIGLVTMPLKLRLGENFDFQGNLSLGSTAGVKIRLSKYSSNYINLLLGTSISTISLDSFSTKGKVIGQPITNIAVLSPSFGLVFEFGKAQAGIFAGLDILNKSTQSKYKWIYNKKPWLSIGFGFSIFNIDGKSNSSQSQKQ